MSQLSNDSPPQYESYYQSQDNILITVIQNEKSFREWGRKMGELDLKFEKISDSPFQGDFRCPKGLEYMLQAGQLLGQMTDLFREATNLLEERISHGQNKLYDTMKKLSDTELDRVFVSSKLGATSHRQPELTWNHKNNKDSHGNFKYKLSRGRMFFHTIQRVWKHLKGRLV